MPCPGNPCGGLPPTALSAPCCMIGLIPCGGCCACGRGETPCGGAISFSSVSDRRARRPRRAAISGYTPVNVGAGVLDGPLIHACSSAGAPRFARGNAPFLFECPKRSGEKKSAIKRGHANVSPLNDLPRLKQMRSADVRRSALQLPGAAMVGTFPGRHKVGGGKFYLHSRGYEVPRRIFPR